MNSNSIFHSIVNHIRESLESSDFMDQFKKPKRFVRNRILSMYQVVIYLLYSNRASMATNIGNIRDDLTVLDFPNVSRQAVSKARQNILPGLFENIFRITVNDYYSMTSDYNLWNGYHIFAIDGSMIHMAESDSVMEDFGRNDDPRYGRHHYMGLGSCLYDISQDIIVDAVLESCTTSERSLAKGHLMKLKELNLSTEQLIIFDRGYYSVDMFNYLVEMGYKCLMRIKQNSKLASCSSSVDEIIESSKLKSPVRVVKIALSKEETEYLVTNVTDPSITTEMFRELYHKRWDIETKYYELKELWDLEKFNGATSCAVKQEFFIFMMKTNLGAIIKSEADKSINEETAGKPAGKKYHACRSFIIGRLSKLLPKYIIGESVKTTVEDLIKEAKRIKSQIRTGRSNKRKKPSNHKINCKNRKTTT